MKTENKKQLYEFTKDYPLSGNKKGDRIPLYRVGPGIKDYVKPVSGSSTTNGGEGEEVPTEKNTKEEILIYLHSNGVDDATEKETKEELLKRVKKVSKQ